MRYPQQGRTAPGTDTGGSARPVPQCQEGRHRRRKQKHCHSTRIKRIVLSIPQKVLQEHQPLSARVQPPAVKVILQMKQVFRINAYDSGVHPDTMEQKHKQPRQKQAASVFFQIRFHLCFPFHI